MTGADAVEVARLRRRAERERTARHEAERIAEESLRDLYLRQQDLAVVARAARAANESDDPDTVIEAILHDVCTHAGWPLGHVFLVKDAVLVSSGLWHDEDHGRFAAFRAASTDVVLSPGVGLPGRVLATGESVWSKGLADDVSLPRRLALGQSGLASGFAFPVLAGSEIVAVLECYSPSDEPPAPRLLDVAAQVAVQAGRSLERRAAHADVQRAQAELESTLEEFARSNRELEAFAYVASHDLQEPLRSMSSFIELLARRYQGQLDERADTYIGFALDAGARMQALVTDLLEYSRVGNVRLQRSAVDLGAVLDQTRAALANAIEEADARIEVGPLPTVQADARQVGQVLTNLVANAVKFRGDEPPVVRVAAERQEAGWRVVVEDEGIGIPADQMAAVFQVFTRLHGREAYPGTGIGLAICQKIVERHGGVIAVEPRPGGGSRFSFTLPDGAPPDRQGVTQGAAG